ncbi:MAG: putative addiction module antidote protein [Fibrobacter sp.]|nr:putative addiction module antidote protein [Fibrobacter sp.]
MKKSDAEVSDLDVADLLKTEEDVILFLEEALAEYDPVLWQICLDDAVRSAGMAKIAKKAGLNRESLYKSLKKDAHPRFDTVMRILKAMGLKLSITPCVAETRTKYSAEC